MKLKNIKKDYLYEICSLNSSREFMVISECVKISKKQVYFKDIYSEKGNCSRLWWITIKNPNDTSLHQITEIGSKEKHPEYFL